MTYEEYMNMPFKTGGNGEPYYMKDELGDLNRRTRRWLKRELHKGNVPSFDEVWAKQMGE